MLLGRGDVLVQPGGLPGLVEQQGLFENKAHEGHPRPAGQGQHQRVAVEGGGRTGGQLAARQQQQARAGQVGPAHRHAVHQGFALPGHYQGHEQGFEQHEEQDDGVGGVPALQRKRGGQRQHQGNDGIGLEQPADAQLLRPPPGPEREQRAQRQRNGLPNGARAVQVQVDAHAGPVQQVRGEKQRLKRAFRVHAAVLHHGGGHAHQQHQPHGHQPQRAGNDGQLLVPVQVKREEAGDAQQQLIFPLLPVGDGNAEGRDARRRRQREARGRQHGQRHQTQHAVQGGHVLAAGAPGQPQVSTHAGQ